MDKETQGFPSSEFFQKVDILRILLDAGKDWVYWVNPEGKCLYSSPAAKDITGYDRRHFQESPDFFLSLVHPDDRDLLTRKLEETRDNPQSCQLEFRIRNRDGEYRWLQHECFPVYDKNGIFLGYRGVNRDISAEKRTAAELTGNRDKFKGIFDYSTDGIVLIDQDFRIVDCNPAMAEITGYRREEMVGKHVAEMTYKMIPENKRQGRSPEFFRRKMEAMLGRGQRPIPPQGKEVEIQRKDGSIRFLQEITFEIPLPEGPLFVNVKHDITERRRQEADLMKLKMALEQSPVAVLITDHNGAIEYVNPAFTHITGYEPEDVKGKSPSILRSEETAPELYDELWNTISHGKTWRGEMLNRRKDGKLYWEKGVINPIRDPQGKITNYLAISEDITQKKKTEQHLRESEEKYRSLFEETLDVVFISSADGRILDINPAGVKLFGYDSREELLNLNLEKELYADPADRRRLVQLLEKDGFVRDFEIRLKRRDGTQIIVLETSTAIRDSETGATIYRGILRDVTEQRNLEQQLLQAQKMEAIGALAGGVAHDFNNLLTVINGYTEMMLDEVDANHPLHPNLQSVLNAGLKARDLTNQLLAFSRKQVHQPRVIDLNRLVLGLQRMMRRLIGEDIALETELGKELPSIKADPAQVEQVLINLLVNARDAVKATKKNRKRIAVSTRLVAGEDLPPLDGKVNRDILHIELSVADNGIGMEAKIRERIFEPFFTTKAKYKGTGLGLSMAYGIIRQNGAWITVDSTPGIGTTFNIYWPTVVETESEGEGETPEYSNYSGTETILVAEDDADVRKVLTEALHNLGYKVLGAADGKAAQALMRKHGKDVDLVITDLIMPEMNGHQLTEFLRAEYPDISIIFVSGYADDLIENYQMHQENFGFLQKPYSMQQLAQKIREILTKES